MLSTGCSAQMVIVPSRHSGAAAQKEVFTTVKLAQTIPASALTNASNVITSCVTTNSTNYYYTVLCCVLLCDTMPYTR